MTGPPPPIPGELARTSLRLALVACLRDANTAAGANVHANRSRPRRPRSEPTSIFVFYDLDEGDVRDGTERRPKTMEHRVEFAVELFASGGVKADGSETPGDLLDVLWGQTIRAIESSDDWGLPGIFAGGRYLRTLWDWDPEGEAIEGACRIVWEARYCRVPCEGDPGFLEPLQKLWAEFKYTPEGETYAAIVQALATVQGGP